MGGTAKDSNRSTNTNTCNVDLDPGTKVRVRASHIKAKGGCTTCKARHVKCDETRPSCQRCLNFWGRCDGYLPPQKRARPKSGLTSVERTRPLLPRASSHAPSPAQDSILTSTPFKSAYEHQGFRNFLTQTAPQLPGLFSSPLWDKVILQASASEPFIRDTLVAIGALNSCGRKWAKDLPAGKKSTTRIEATPQLQFALQQYGTAVKSMRKKLASYENDKGSSVRGTKERKLRLALISCILVVCFEALEGNHFLAQQHAVSGHKILQDWLSQHSPVEPASSEPFLYSSSTTTLMNADASTTGLGSPAPHLIEDELIRAFSNLDIQIITLGDTRPPSLHSKLKHEGSHAIASMPSPFTSVEQARLYWELIQRRTSHFIGAAAGETSLRKDSQMNIDMGLGSGSVSISPESEIMFSTSELPPTLLAEYHSYASEITRWFASFSPFYEKLVEGSRSWTASSLLKIHALGQQVLMHSSILSDEWSLDSFAPIFSEMVSLGQLVAQDPLYSTPNLFTFEIGLVNPIRSVSKWCRDPRIRRDSIALLRKIATREGIWDALTMASVSEWMMEMEEERMAWIPDGMGGERPFISKEDRVRTMSVVIDSFKREATVMCSRLGRREDGSVDERTTVITW
ncbi:uncharacterized protein PAC_07949 [Phialocephala subalpina]|uniref:Zn(2)-C6 fungal-type domain-containing protein n=1 Tax=Phialocephala subalpina TaxID=576137 RepID=A0A1L7WZ51_9HELO|nr:uncharacterized protein PAC_07949 [Phialocephala subalpina]